MVKGNYTNRKKKVSKYFVRGCSSSEVGSVKTYVEKVSMNWVFNWISFEVYQKFPVFMRAYVYLFADLEITTLV